jgi:phenylpropionate dioxygenase-like ring-hydroxylating dioxygenase large terminal subunit
MTTATSLNASQNVLPAGGIDPSSFDWKQAWYPVYYTEDLDKTKLSKLTLLEQDIVIWWDKTDLTWRAFSDQCPHRLAPLSEGRINESGQLECPYHGWTFSGKGNCENIPQQEAGGQAQSSQRACVRAFPTTVRQGLLFVFAGNPDHATQTPVPTIDVLDDPSDEWVCLNIFRDLPYDALTLLENVLDASHVPYTHHRTVGDRANASPVNLEVIQADRQGFQGIWEEGPRKGTLGRQTTFFVAPNLMWHDLTSKQFGRTLTVVYATPIRKGECRLFARFPFKFSAKIPRLAIKLTPAWYSHLGQNRVLEDDQIFLHAQERYLEKNGGSEKFSQAFYLPTKADLFVSELRKWVNQYQAEAFVSQSLSPVLSSEILLDRYHSHTKNCASCRAALANIQRLKLGSIVLGAIALILTPILFLSVEQNQLVGISLSSILLISFILYISLNQLEKKFYQGNPIPPRNLPDKKGKRFKP